jgi:hypothetical protein
MPIGGPMWPSAPLCLKKVMSFCKFERFEPAQDIIHKRSQREIYGNYFLSAVEYVKEDDTLIGNANHES